jgi:hypothetical protein
MTSKMTIWRRKNPDKYREEVRKTNERYKIRMETEPEFRKKEQAKRRKNKYGISNEAFIQLIEKQNNKCAGCLIEFKDDGERHLDHCHKTGAIRGLLCRNCNLAVGNAQDSIAILIRLTEYLISFEMRWSSGPYEKVKAT